MNKCRYFIVQNCNQPIKFWPDGQGCWIHKHNKSLKYISEESSGYTIDVILNLIKQWEIREVTLKEFKRFCLSKENSLI